MVSTHRVAPGSQRDRRIDRDSWVPTFGPGQALGAVATTGLVVAMFMSWRIPALHPSGIPFAFLLDQGTTAQHPSILLALVPMAILLGVGTAMPRARAARIVGALGTIVVAVLFVIQLNRRVVQVPGANMSDVLDTGFYVAVIAALVGLVSGFLPSGWAQLRRTQTESTVDSRASTWPSRASDPFRVGISRTSGRDT